MINKIQLVGLVVRTDISELDFVSHVMNVAERSKYLGQLSKCKDYKKSMVERNGN